MRTFTFTHVEVTADRTGAIMVAKKNTFTSADEDMRRSPILR